MVCVLHGPCAVERSIVGHWVEQAMLVNGGVVVVTGQAPVRIDWKSTPDGVALSLAADQMTGQLDTLVQSLAADAMIQLPVDAIAMSFGKALSTMRQLGMQDAATSQVIELMVKRIGEILHERVTSQATTARALSQWRLRRVAAFVQERLDGEICLADMAEACGLSPMYFAAQFRAATGMRPHDYLVMQRIEQAKRMLRQSRVSILDVALSVGFRTQAHFTTVFKRVEKRTPRDWRRMSLAA